MAIEEKKAPQAGVKVVLGGQEYEIKPLAIKYSAPWRKKVIEMIGSLAPYADTVSGNLEDFDPKDFNQALAQVLVDTPDRMGDLFFEYAKDLNRDEIEGVATDYELAEAFGKVIEMAFAFCADTFTRKGIK